MGFVTIHLQHGWQIESSKSSKNGLPTPYTVHSPTENAISPPSPKDGGFSSLAASTLQKAPLSSLIRLTLPASVAQLVKYFNCTQESNQLRELEEAVRDVLSRLELLVLASCIPDPSRFDHIRSRLHLSAPKSDRKSSEKTTPETTIRSSSEGRISVLMLTRCRSHLLRQRALALLVEALDTNHLSTTSHETMHLQMLWVEMVQLFRHVLDTYRRRSFQMLDSEDAATPIPPPDNSARTLIDSRLQSLLTCISLTLQRLDHIQDIQGQPLAHSNLMSQSYACILEDLALCYTTDPFTFCLLSTIRSQVQEWIDQSNGHELSRKQVSLDLGVHVLSQVIRMTPPENLYEMKSQFHAVFAELHKSGSWNLGKKLLTILGTAALLNQDATIMYISLLSSLHGMHWQWRFLGIGILGSIVCTAPSPQIRKIAIEQGLVSFLHFTSSPSTNDANSSQQDNQVADNFSDADAWLTRASAVVSLTEVYQQHKANIHGLYAREVMAHWRLQEIHPTVLSLLNDARAKTPQLVFFPRLSTLFKHTSTAFAESYVALESEYKYMRNFIHKAEANERNLHHHTTTHHLKQKKKKKQSIPKLNHLIAPDPLYMSSRPQPTLTSSPQFLNLKDLPLQLFASPDYHSHYKRPLFTHDSYDTLLPPIPPNKHLSPSFISTTPGIHVPSHTAPGVGTANRRKLFNPPRPNLRASIVDESEFMISRGAEGDAAASYRSKHASSSRSEHASSSSRSQHESSSRSEQQHDPSDMPPAAIRIPNFNIISAGDS